MKIVKKKTNRDLLVSNGWIQAVAIVVVFGFFVLGLLAYRTHRDEPPIPASTVRETGEVLFTRQDVVDGQGVFLRNGLMEYGSIFGHGAYLGPDFTADYLHRAALLVIDAYGGPSSDQARARAITDFTSNRYDAETDTLIFSNAQAEAFGKLKVYYHDFFADPTSKYGLRPEAITEPQQTRQLTAFFCWTAWAASARRPALAYSYTNNWPPEPLLDNHPTADTVIWSVLSLIALLGGIGILLAAFGRWNFLGWHGSEQQAISFRPPNEVLLTPSQRSCSWFFLVMALLFLLQALLG
jgi:nitric oxide reductase subunit B